MSRRKPLVLLIIAAVLGLLATTATARYLEKRVGARSGKTVLVVAEDLSPGTCITREHLKEMCWPAADIPASLITDYDNAVEWYVASPMKRGEPLVTSKLSRDTLGGKIAGYIPPGHRAMAIRVDRAVKAGGLLEAGSFVDVLTVISRRGHVPVSKIILQNIKVLSVGVRKTVDGEEDGDESAAPGPSGSEEAVTLLLRPDEAEKLALAMTKGKIQLMARGTADVASISTEGFSSDAFLPEKKEPEQPVAPVAPEAEPEPPGPEYTAETLFNTAQTLEAKGELDAARQLYKQVAAEFADHKLAAEAVRQARHVVAKLEEKTNLGRVEENITSAREFLAKGLFDECRKQVNSIIEEFGPLTYRGEEIADVVSRIKLKADDREKRARIDFQLFRNWLQNDNHEQALVYLKKLEDSYPESTYYHQGVAMLAEAEAQAVGGRRAEASEQAENETERQ